MSSKRQSRLECTKIMSAYVYKILFTPVSPSDKSEKLENRVKQFTTKEVENKKLEVSLQYKDVVESLNEAFGKEMDKLSQELHDLETKYHDIDTESSIVISKYEKENKCIKKQINDLEDKSVGDELYIMNLKIENEQLKEEISKLKSADENDCLFNFFYDFFYDFFHKQQSSLLKLLPDDLQDLLLEHVLYVESQWYEPLSERII